MAEARIKPIYFKKKLGITLENAEILIQAIEKAIITEPETLNGIYVPPKNKQNNPIAKQIHHLSANSLSQCT
ncbi:hypothetical protein H6G45_02280 [Synechocystis sp. FACHB-383]|uniref:hypothetical protein n=1 Tax=Synechocystis sp. FACHB-383 TaxID=2692864 RepID=UPI001683AF5D|nr:hypothetical protein [Synechocystis sp. FACHB-383]MBD2652338.1 hypothetical protein [Synechocystis sp. FACHB-383]